MRTSVRTTPELSGCNSIRFFNTFCGSRTVCEAGTNADIARLCINPLAFRTGYYPTCA